MLVSKTVRAELYGLTRSKMERLEDLLTEWNRAQSLEREYKKLRQQTRLPSYYCRALSWKAGDGRKSPVLLDKDAFRVVEVGNRFARFFVSIPTPNGRIWCPLRMWKSHERLLSSNGVEISDSQLIRRGGRFYLHLTIKRRIKLTPSSSVLAVDLGERFLAASVALSKETSINSPRLHGKEARGIRRHYAWLRKRLGERKLLGEIKRVGQTESRRIDNLCHKISREIVDEAKERNAVIVVGDLKGIRERSMKRGRRFRRIVSNMPHDKLTRYVEYKALWAGIPVVLASEDYSSKTCHRCGNGGRRVSQGLFKCPSCGLEYNADLNGAINMGKRFADHWLADGALGFVPLREEA